MKLRPEPRRAPLSTRDPAPALRAVASSRPRRVLHAGGVLFVPVLLAFPLLARATPVPVAPRGDWAKKEGREEIALLARGQIESATASYMGRLSADPRHGEALFGMAVARSMGGREAEALSWCKRALEAGVPIERFLAGPRDLLAPLVASDGFRKLLEARERPLRLLHGPLLGSVSDRAASSWVRTAAESTFRVLARLRTASPGTPPLASPRVRTLAERDFTAVATLEGLLADREYAYWLEIDGERVEGELAFRTFPREDAPARFSIAFGGGAAYTPPFERMFRTILGRHPRAFLQLGDNVYIDHPDLLAVQRYCYYRRQSSPPYRELVARVPVAAIWDDHDFGTNDCHGGPQLLKPAWKLPVWDVFRENWCNPAYGGGEAHPGCWFDFRIADVHFLMLDCRMWRTSPRRKPRTMLGPVQKAWLLERLKSSKATFKIIASSVPFASGVKPGSPDPWDGYPEEREEIFSFIAKEGIEGVVLIAADRHRSDAWRIERPGAYDLYELESSRLTNVHVHKLVKGSLFGFNRDRSFAFLEFDTTLEDPTVTYTIVTIDGEPAGSLTLQRSALKSGARASPRD